MTHSKIIGVGAYLPDKIYDNAYMESIVDTTDEWIVERTGIKKRHIAADGEYTSDLAYQAALNAVLDAGLDVAEIDCIILATVTSDLVLPSTAVILQEKLGINKNCFAFDIQAACSGFIYAVDMADALIKSKKVKTALVVAAETTSRIVDWSDRSTCVLFGDGAGAIVLRATEEEKGIIYTKIASDGYYVDFLKTNGGLSRSLDDIFIKMQGREVFKIAVGKMCESIEECLQALNLRVDDIGIIIPHQANQRILDGVGKKLNLSSNKLHSTIREHGNTMAASIPLALHDARKNNKIKDGDIVVFESLGAGITWGVIAIKW